MCLNRKHAKVIYIYTAFYELTAVIAKEYC